MAERDRRGLNNVVMIGQLPKAMMPVVWGATDAALVLLKRLDTFKSAHENSRALYRETRRIGLTDGGEKVPLYGGLRLTGRAGKYGLGFLSMQSEGRDGVPSQNYTVARVRRDLFGSSDIGAIVLSREPSGSSRDFNRVAGADVNFRVFKSLSLNGFAARSDTPGETRNQGTGKASAVWEDSKKRFTASVMSIGEGFRDDMGFVRRTGVTRTFLDWASFVQSTWLRTHDIFQLEPHARVFSYYDPHGDLVTRMGHVALQSTWTHGSRIEYAFEPREEAITKPFAIRNDVAIPSGRYEWNQHLWVIETDHSRALSFASRITHGGFWSGSQKNIQTSMLLRPNYRLFFDVGLQVTVTPRPHNGGYVDIYSDDGSGPVLVTSSWWTMTEGTIWHGCFPLGDDTLTAKFRGVAPFGNSESEPVDVTVTKRASSTQLLVSPNPVPSDYPAVFTLDTWPGAGTTVRGTVRFGVCRAEQCGFFNREFAVVAP